MNGCKYVVLGDENGYGDKMIVFDSSIEHKRMAQGMKRVTRLPNVLSAGFIDEFGNCYGESITLGTSARKDIDTLLFQCMMDFDDKEIGYKNDGCDRCADRCESDGKLFCQRCGARLKKLTAPELTPEQIESIYLNHAH